MFDCQCIKNIEVGAVVARWLECSDFTGWFFLFKAIVCVLLAHAVENDFNFSETVWAVQTKTLKTQKL
jgi:hypothetical protein